MTGHYYLKIDPDELRFVAKRLDGMHDHLHAKGAKASACPADIGDDWQGAAATAIKLEMSGLGGQMTSFSSQFHTSSSVITSLAKDYEDALDQVDTLNKKWDAADTTYAGAIKAANDTYTNATTDNNKLPGPVRKSAQSDSQDSRNYAQGVAYDARQKTRGDLDTQFALIKAWLRTQTSAAGTSLSDAAPSTVTDQQINDWKNGRYPTRLSHPGLLAAMATAAAREQAQAVAAAKAAAQQDVNDLQGMEKHKPLEDPQAYQDLLARIGAKAGDPLYAKALVDILGPSGVNDVYNTINYTVAVNLSGDHNRNSDYASSLKAFNNTLAAGLAHYSDHDLSEFTDQLTTPAGGPAKLGMIAVSSYADDRLTGTAASYLSRMREQDQWAGGIRRDIAVDQLVEETDGYDGLAKTLADRTDPATFSHYFNGLDDDAQQAMLDRLLDDGQPNNGFSDDLKAKARVFSGLVDQAVDAGDVVPVKRLLEAMRGDRVGLGYQQVLAEQLRGVFDNPAHIEWFAQNIGDASYQIDPEMLGRIATDAFKGIDVSNLAGELAAYAKGPERAAQDVGFLLSLADVSETKVDYSGVVESLVSLGVDKADNPLLSAAFGPLSALYDAMKEADDKYGSFGDGWSQETQHEVLAFTIYASHTGAPPGFAEFVASHQAEFERDQSAAGDNQTDRYIQEWINEASSSDPSSPEYKAWKDMQRYETTIGDFRGIGK